MFSYKKNKMKPILESYGFVKAKDSRLLFLMVRRVLRCHAIAQDFSDMADRQTVAGPLGTAAQLHDATRAFGHQKVGAGGPDVIEFAFQDLGGDLGKLAGIGPAEPAAGFLLRCWFEVEPSLVQERPGGFPFAQAAAQVAGSMIGHRLLRGLESFGFQFENPVGKLGKGEHFFTKRPGFGGLVRLSVKAWA